MEKTLWDRLSEHHQKLITNANINCCGFFDYNIIRRLQELTSYHYLTTRELSTIFFLLEKEVEHPQNIFYNES